MIEKKELIVLHVANLTDDKSKGPNTNVPKNVIYGNKYSNVGLYNLCGDKLAISVPKNKLFTSDKYGSIDDLPKPFNKPSIVVFQGVYFVKYCQIAKWLKKNGIPYIIVPRCSMTTAGIKSHWLKKKVAGMMLFNKFISDSSAIQFLTKNEFLESKNNFKFDNYFILGNGFETPKKNYIIKSRKEFKITFVGRYNIYHKGLDVLLETVKDYAEWFRKNSVFLELYGGDSDNGLAFLNNIIIKNCIGDIIHVNGPVFNKEKEEAILDADVFIHTSRLEGQPTSVIEAISYGVPVIVTYGTNIADEVKENMLGYIVGLDKDAIFNGIKEAFLDKNRFGYISKNEIRYAEGAFNWDNILKCFTTELGKYGRHK